MPVESKAQFRWAQAAAHGDIPGTAPSVGKEFLQHTAQSYSSLPAKVSKKRGKKNGRTRRTRK